MIRLNKAELISAIADNAGVSRRVAERLLNATIEEISGALENGETVQLVGFGTFEVRHRAERVGRNVTNQKPVKIKAQNMPVFRAGKPLRTRVQNKS